MATVLIGEKRYLLTLLEKISGEKTTSIAIFKCRCDCGNIKEIKRNKFGITKSCGCLRSRKGEANPNFTGCGELSGRSWESIRRNAKNRKIPFSITVKDAWDIFQKQQGYCALSGTLLTFSEDPQRKRSQGTASLDRIDNTKGYVKDNVHWVHKRINQIKMDMKLSEFILWCSRVYQHANFTRQ